MNEMELLKEEELNEIEGGNTSRFWSYVSYEIVNTIKNMIHS